MTLSTFGVKKGRWHQPFCYPMGKAVLQDSSIVHPPIGTISTWYRYDARLEVLYGKAWIYYVVFKVLSKIWRFEMVIPFDRTINHHRGHFLHTVWTLRPARNLTRFYPRLIPPGDYNVTLSGHYFATSEGVFHEDLV